MATSQPPAAPAKISVWEDVVDIFTSPSEVFARRAGGSVWVPLGIFVLLSAIIFVATKGMMQPIFDAEWTRATARAMAKNPSVTADQMAQGRPIFEKAFAVIFVLTGPISIAVMGVVTWLVGKAFGAVESIGDAMLIATYAWFPRLVAHLVAAAMLVLADPAKLNSVFSPTLSVGKFLDRDATQRTLFLLAGRADVFVLWQTVLFGIGLSVLGKIPRANAFIAAVLIFLVGSGLFVLVSG